MWSNFCCNRNYNRNFQLCLFLIFASSFINRYPLYSVLLRKSNILQLQMLNYHLGQAQKIIKTSKINIIENFCYNFCYNRNWTRRIGLFAYGVFNRLLYWKCTYLVHSAFLKLCQVVNFNFCKTFCTKSNVK